MDKNGYKAYQRNSVLTATPGELTLLLYNGCIKLIRQGRLAMSAGNIEEKNTYLLKAQRIVQELIVTLDRKQPVSEEFLPLYEYMHRRLIEANMKNDTAILDEVERLTITFRDTWKQVMEKAKSTQPKRERV
ncbi:MAG: flagellar export chaperone FliS [Sporolactobacillus sp.]